MQTRQQQWAQEAFQRVQKLEEPQKKEYRYLARRFPGLVHECGLAQAMAYLQNNEKNEERKSMLKHLEEILEIEGLAQSSRKAELSEYLFLSQRVMEAAGWLKRYAEALIPATEEE